MMKMVKILGEEYSIHVMERDADPKLKEVDGYCDWSTKRIVVADLFEDEEDSMDVGNKTEVQMKVMRHEIVHGFLEESGLSVNSEWARNEEVVDWIAMQIEKMVKAMKEVNAI